MNEYYSVFFSFAGTLIVLLLAIIGFFLRQQITVIQILTDTVNALKTSMEVVHVNEENLRSSCALKHAVVDRRLDSHGVRLDKSDITVAQLEAIIAPNKRKSRAN
jgi:hypothetical protein